MKRVSSYFSLSALLLVCASLASAQSTFDLNMGFGTARVGSSGSGIDNASSINAFGTCVPSSADTFCQATPGLGGFFLGLGGDVMFTKRFGVGAEVNLQPAKSDYGPLQFRQTFYDFNGIFAPVNQKRFLVQLAGGIGGARTGFSFTENSCVGTAVCSNVSQPVGNSSHFQVHTGVGFQVMLTDHLFIRPQFDLHYVPNFTDQFGSNVVPQGSVWFGYSFGDR